jgi:hypothetical protein
MRKESKEMIGRILTVVGVVGIICVILGMIRLATASWWGYARFEWFPRDILFLIGAILLVFMGLAILCGWDKKTVIKDEHGIHPIIYGGIITVVGDLILIGIPLLLLITNPPVEPSEAREKILILSCLLGLFLGAALRYLGLIVGIIWEIARWFKRRK